MSRLPFDDSTELTMARLFRAGWSIGEAKSGKRFNVTGINGENSIKVSGLTSAEAWSMALAKAKAVGMVGA